jgi:protein SCO1/2
VRSSSAVGIFFLALLLCANAIAQENADHAHHQPASGMPIIDEIRVDFELLDTDGALVTDESFRGQFVLLAFGFTHCETVCPIMAFTMAQALAGTDENAVGFFVSVDTERDSPASTHRYAAAFDERMIGLGGDYARINAVTGNFNVSYAVTKTRDSYVVQHTANIFLIDPAGELREVFSVSARPDDIVEAMQARGE